MKIILFAIALIIAIPSFGYAQQPEFSKPQPKEPRVSSGCSSPTCWYLCSITKVRNQLPRAVSIYEMAKYDYTDGDFALDLALSIATHIGHSSVDVDTRTIAYFNSVEAFAEAAKSYMIKNDMNYFITGVCKK
jgi:hypothetical protein